MFNSIHKLHELQEYSLNFKISQFVSCGLVFLYKLQHGGLSIQ